MENENCRYWLGSLSDFIDGSLRAELCAQIEQHMAECENCRIVVNSLNKTIYLYRTASEGVSVPEDVRERLYRCLNLEDYLES